jgi:hypothetical protein
MPTFPPPSIVIEIRYDFYQMARDKYYKNPASQPSLQGAYYFIEYDWSFFHNAVVQIIPSSVRVHTPVSSGRLSQSIEMSVPGFLRPGPTEALQWAFYYDGAWHDTIETSLPRYYYETFVCYSNAYYMDGNSYAMPVEIGSAPHTPPIQRLREWVYLHWNHPEGRSDPEAAWRLQAVIRGRGTPEYAMFWKGLALAQSEIMFNTSSLLDPQYWTIEHSDYHLSPVDL